MFNFNTNSFYKSEEMKLDSTNKEKEYISNLSASFNIEIEEISIFNESEKTSLFNNNIFKFEDINEEELYFIDKSKIKDLNENKKNEIPSNPHNICVKVCKRGRKPKILIEERNHNNKTFDNLFKKIKHNLLEIVRVFLNNKIKDVYKDDEELSSIEILKLDQTQSDNSTIAFNKIFIYKTLREIFSAKITTKYKTKKDNLEFYNKEMFNKLLNGKDIEKRNFFESILNLKFIDIVDYIVGKRNDLIQLYELSLPTALLEVISIDKDYSDILYDTMKNLEKILNEKKSRKRKKMIKFKKFN